MKKPKDVHKKNCSCCDVCGECHINQMNDSPKALSDCATKGQEGEEVSNNKATGYDVSLSLSNKSSSPSSFEKEIVFLQNAYGYKRDLLRRIFKYLEKKVIHKFIVERDYIRKIDVNKKPMKGLFEDYFVEKQKVIDAIDKLTSDKNKGDWYKYYVKTKDLKKELNLK